MSAKFMIIPNIPPKRIFWRRS